MSRRTPTQKTDGPWPFLFSVVLGRGIVRNTGVRSRPRTTIPKDMVLTEEHVLAAMQAVAVEEWKKANPSVVDPFAVMTKELVVKPTAGYKFRKSHGSRWSRK